MLFFGGYRNKNCSAVLPTHLQLCVNVAHAPMNGVQRLHTAATHCCLILLAESVGVKLQLHTKRSSKYTPHSIS